MSAWWSTNLVSDLISQSLNTCLAAFAHLRQCWISYSISAFCERWLPTSEKCWMFSRVSPGIWIAAGHCSMVVSWWKAFVFWLFSVGHISHTSHWRHQWLPEDPHVMITHHSIVSTPKLDWSRQDLGSGSELAEVKQLTVHSVVQILSEWKLVGDQL